MLNGIKFCHEEIHTTEKRSKREQTQEYKKLSMHRRTGTLVNLHVSILIYCGSLVQTNLTSHPLNCAICMDNNCMGIMVKMP